MRNSIGRNVMYQARYSHGLSGLGKDNKCNFLTSMPHLWTLLTHTRTTCTHTNIFSQVNIDTYTHSKFNMVNNNIGGAKAEETGLMQHRLYLASMRLVVFCYYSFSNSTYSSTERHLRHIALYLF